MAAVREHSEQNELLDSFVSGTACKIVARRCQQPNGATTPSTTAGRGTPKGRNKPERPSAPRRNQRLPFNGEESAEVDVGAGKEVKDCNKANERVAVVQREPRGMQKASGSFLRVFASSQKGAPRDALGPVGSLLCVLTPRPGVSCAPPRPARGGGESIPDGPSSLATVVVITATTVAATAAVPTWIRAPIRSVRSGESPGGGYVYQAPSLPPPPAVKRAHLECARSARVESFSPKRTISPLCARPRTRRLASGDSACRARTGEVKEPRIGDEAQDTPAPWFHARSIAAVDSDVTATSHAWATPPAPARFFQASPREPHAGSSSSAAAAERSASSDSRRHRCDCPGWPPPVAEYSRRRHCPESEPTAHSTGPPLESQSVVADDDAQVNARAPRV
ncbi:unnamed protein product [Lampetra planeri]